MKRAPFPPTVWGGVSDGVLYLIEYEKFYAEFLHDPHIALSFISSLSKKIKVLQNFIHTTISSDAHHKIASFLLQNQDALEHLKQVEIAAILNIAPETLSRNLAKMKRDGLIQKSQGKVILQDIETLKNLVNN